MTRLFEPQISHIVSKSAMIVLAKGTRKMRRVNTDERSDSFQSQVVSILIMKPVLDLLQPKWGIGVLMNMLTRGFRHDFERQTFNRQRCKRIGVPKFVIQSGCHPNQRAGRKSRRRMQSRSATGKTVEPFGRKFDIQYTYRYVFVGFRMDFAGRVKEQCGRATIACFGLISLGIRTLKNKAEIRGLVGVSGDFESRGIETFRQADAGEMPEPGPFSIKCSWGKFGFHSTLLFTRIVNDSSGIPPQGEQ